MSTSALSKTLIISHGPTPPHHTAPYLIQLYSRLRQFHTSALHFTTPAHIQRALHTQKPANFTHPHSTSPRIPPPPSIYIPSNTPSVIRHPSPIISRIPIKPVSTSLSILSAPFQQAIFHLVTDIIIHPPISYQTLQNLLFLYIARLLFYIHFLRSLTNTDKGIKSPRITCQSMEAVPSTVVRGRQPGDAGTDCRGAGDIAATETPY